MDAINRYLLSYFSSARCCLVLRDAHMGKTRSLLSWGSNFRGRRNKQEAEEKMKQVAASENDVERPTLSVTVKEGLSEGNVLEHFR